MARLKLGKFKKGLICLMTLLLVFSLIYGLLFFKAEKAKAQLMVPVPVGEIGPFGEAVTGFSSGQLADQLAKHVEDTTDKITQKILDQVQAVFFKNVLGNLTKLLASSQRYGWPAAAAAKRLFLLPILISF